MDMTVNTESMKKVWREYGMIAVLFIVAVGGYFYVGEHKEDILSYSLDAIGDRLVQLVDDPGSKAQIADAFDRFKARVLANEVPTDQVETIAADVLNLSTNGEKLSSEEAEMVLQFSMEPLAAALPIPESDEFDGNESDITPVAPERPPAVALEEVGSRISALIAFAEQAETVVTASDPGIRSHYRFTSDDGLGVEMDSVSGMLWSMDTMKDLAREIEDLHLVTWADDVEANRSVLKREAEKHRSTIEEIRIRMEAPMAGTVAGLLRLERLNQLREKGFGAGLETAVLNMRMDLVLKGMLKNLNAGQAVESAPDNGSGSDPN